MAHSDSFDVSEDEVIVQDAKRKKSRDGLIKGEVIGRGSYSKVYRMRSPGGSLFALKRLFADDKTDFFENLAELDINNRLSHPHIMPIERIIRSAYIGDGILSPIESNRGKETRYKDDDIHFIFPLAASDLADYISEYELSPRSCRRVIAEILLALEYIHTRGYIHRDIKPGNILMFPDEKKVDRVRIGDFGLAKPYVPNIPQTPGVATSWYRAPEISLGLPYDTKADIWSAGCTFYEILTGEVLFCGKITENPTDLIANIFSKLPYKIEAYEFYVMDVHKVCIRVSIPYEPVPMKKFFGIKKFPDETIEVLLAMLQINPTKRPSATELLDMSYFDPIRQYIDNIRAEYPPGKRTIKKYLVYSSVERTWMSNVAYFIYKNKNQYGWYTHRILFQAVSLFDRALHNGKKFADMTIVPSDERGRIFTKTVTKLYFYTCLYMAIKYFSAMKTVVTFNQILPRIYRTQKYITMAHKFEQGMIESILNTMIYQETVYDRALSIRSLKEDECRSLLLFVLRGGHKNLSPRNAYNAWIDSTKNKVDKSIDN